MLEGARIYFLPLVGIFPLDPTRKMQLLSSTRFALATAAAFQISDLEAPPNFGGFLFVGAVTCPFMQNLTMRVRRGCVPGSSGLSLHSFIFYDTACF